MNDGTTVMWMRGGTSKGAYFLAQDLPSDPDARNNRLLQIMGSPDPRQIDGMGGADPLTSKIAIVQKSERAGVDVDYLFLQVFVDQPIVTDAQNCGNILAGVGPFAIERGLVPANNGETSVTIFMENTGQTAVARVPTPDRRVEYAGDARIDGVPGTAAAIPLEFRETAGSTCGALFPTGNALDTINGLDVTLIDNGMPCILLRASDLGISGDESPETLEADAQLRSKLEHIRLIAGPLMNLGDVAEKSVPKLTLLSAPKQGGAINTRTFIPHKCHTSIGVLGAVSVATGCLTTGSVGHALTQRENGNPVPFSIEHPTGELTVIAQFDGLDVSRTEVLRTARKILDGVVF